MNKRTIISLAAITVFAFTSCKRCYQCITETSIENTGAWFTGPSPGPETEFCGTKKQRSNYEKEKSGYDTIKTNIGGVDTIVVQITRTRCN